jgi:Saxitoxin biosynthesis operon protein SxtJ
MRGPAVHEDFSRDVEVRPSSDRVFGLTIAVALALLAVAPVLRHRPLRGWALALTATWLVPTLLRPRLLRPAHRLWLGLGRLLQRVMTPVVMMLLFYGTVTPVALLLRLWGKDLLGREIDRAASTYWIARQPPGPTSDTMRRQF